MELPIKVLAIVNKLVPAGLENRLMDIIRNIDRESVRVDVFTYQLEPGIYDDEVRSLGGIVYYNPSLTVKNMFWYTRYFRDFLKAHPEYRIVHAYQDAWCSVFCRGAFLAGIPVRIAHSRSSYLTKGLKNYIRNIIKIPTRWYANYYFAVSDKAGKWLYGDRLYAKGQVQVWPNAIDARSFYFNESVRNRVRESNGWTDKYVVIHVGNYTFPKNHPFIFDVFDEVYKRDDSAILVLVGDGDRAYIEELIKDHDLAEAVSLLGSRTDVKDLLQGADIFLFPSLYEGLPGALVEAQAAGLPCIYSDVITEEVRITPSVTVKPLSDPPEEWARCIMDYKGYKRRDTSEYIREKGFDVKDLTERLCIFYENSLKKAGLKDSVNERGVCK